MAFRAITGNGAFQPFAILVLLAGCNAGSAEPATAKEVEAAVRRAERAMAAAEAKQSTDRSYAQAYASLPY